MTITGVDLIGPITEGRVLINRGWRAACSIWAVSGRKRVQQWGCRRTNLSDHLVGEHEERGLDGKVPEPQPCPRARCIFPRGNSN